MKYDRQKLARFESDLRVKMGTTSGLSRQLRDLSDSIRENDEVVLSSVKRSTQAMTVSALLNLPEDEQVRLGIDLSSLHYVRALRAQKASLETRADEVRAEIQTLSQLLESCKKWAAEQDRKG